MCFTATERQARGDQSNHNVVRFFVMFFLDLFIIRVLLVESEVTKGKCINLIFSYRQQPVFLWDLYIRF